MFTIRGMGFGAVHNNGINFEKPDGSCGYLLLVVKTGAEFEFTNEQIEQSKRYFETHRICSNKEFYRLYHDNVRHQGMVRCVVDRPGIILYTPGAPQFYYSDDLYINDWVYFESDGEDGFVSNLEIPTNTVITLLNLAEISGLILDLKKEYHQAGEHHGQIIDAKLKTLLYKFSDSLSFELKLTDKLKVHRTAFMDIRQKIYDHNKEIKSVALLADELSMSVSYFEHLYKEIFGVSVISDIIKSRIEKACSLLLIGQESISCVAENCGYDNVEHFNRQFKQVMGITPRQYSKFF